MKNFFSTVDKITYEGTSSPNKFSFKYYNPDETINNKRMEDHLRFAACYWHNFVWPVQIHLVGILLKGLGLVII